MALLILELVRLKDNYISGGHWSSSKSAAPLGTAVHRKFHWVETMGLDDQRISLSENIVGWQIKTPYNRDPIHFPLYRPNCSEVQLPKLSIQIEEQLFLSAPRIRNAQLRRCVDVLL